MSLVLNNFIKKLFIICSRRRQPAIDHAKQVSGDTVVFQEDNISSHPAKDICKWLQQERPDFICPNRWPPNSRDHKVCVNKVNSQETGFLQPASPLRNLTCHMRSHSVTWHPSEVYIPAFTSAKAGTRFSDPVWSVRIKSIPNSCFFHRQVIILLMYTTSLLYCP